MDVSIPYRVLNFKIDEIKSMDGEKQTLCAICIDAGAIGIADS